MRRFKKTRVQNMKNNQGGNKSKASKDNRALAKEKNIQLALLHRATGLSYSQIAIEMGVSKAQAGRYVKEGLDRKRKETEAIAEQVIMLDLLRIEQHLVANYEACQAGSVKAIKTDLELMEARQKLLGLRINTEIEYLNNIATTKQDNRATVYGVELARIFVEKFPHKAQSLIQEKGNHASYHDVVRGLMEENPEA